MKYFIEVTDKVTGRKICLPIARIKSVSVDEDGSTFVETDIDGDGTPVGVICQESYSRVKLELLRLMIQN